MAAKLKAFVKDLADIDEGLHPLYVEQGEEAGGGFVLDIDEKEYKKTLDEFRKNNRALFKDKEALQAVAEKFKDVDLDKYKQATDALAQLDQLEEKDLLKAGKLDEVVAKRTGAMKSDYEKQLDAQRKAYEAMKSENGEYRNKLGQLVIDTSVQGAVTKVGRVRPQAMDDVLARARRVFTINEKGEMVPKSNGETVFGKSGEPLTAEEWGTRLLAEAPHLFESSQGGGSGGGNRGDGGGHRGATVDRNDPVAMGKNADGIAKGTVKVV